MDGRCDGVDGAGADDTNDDQYIYFKSLIELLPLATTSSTQPQLSIYKLMSIRSIYNQFDDISLCRYDPKRSELQILTTSDIFVYTITLKRRKQWDLPPRPRPRKNSYEPRPRRKQWKKPLVRAKSWSHLVELATPRRPNCKKTIRF